MMSNTIPETIFILDIFRSFHKIRASNGDNGNRTDEDPRIPCKAEGKGKIAAPEIEKEKARINKTGTKLSPVLFAVV
jgi:hypothetical protein